MIDLLIVDDEPLIRSGLSGALSQFPHLRIVGEAEDGETAVTAARQLRPDVVLMDVRMPGRDGLSATKELTDDRSFSGAILVLTTFDSDDYVYQAMALGARGFLLKRWPIARIADAISIASAGESVVFPDSLARIVADHGSPPKRSSGEIEAELTPREQVVLKQVAAGLNNAEIAERLHVTVDTVKSQVSSVLLKLNVRDRTQAVIRAFESGFAAAESGPDRSAEAGFSSRR
ncbi:MULTISPECIES: response regulator [Brevibacterium]|uniref:response regulator n=1 Tax=Brevibacterium TaxID=1696 RepID=UPI001552A59D|nr:response regulator transcription factor [Brevibacterium sp. CT2-23B]